MSKNLFITDVEKRTDPTLVIYWLGTDENKREFGVCFSNGYTNIANQGVVESVALALSIVDDMVNKL